MRIVIVAGESSGDQLAAGLISAILRHNPDVEFEGIAGPLMRAAGCKEIFPAERLAVMGLFEVLGRLPELLKIRHTLLQYLYLNPPDLFIGVDAPDFNLPVERRIKSRGIKVLHYVSPSVWAWRRGRLPGIKKAVDHLLTLFPFEKQFFQQHQIAVTCVGHPLADELSQLSSKSQARKELGLAADNIQVALLPGSRGGEYRRLTPIFLRAALILSEKGYPVQFLLPAIDDRAKDWISKQIQKIAGDLSLRLVDQQSRLVMQAADLVLLASGTATLEAMLLQKPMVVAYRFSTLTYLVLKRMVRTPYFSLPNLLAGERLVPELIQNQATPERCARELQNWLDHPEKVSQLRGRFSALAGQLGDSVNNRAAEVALQLLPAAD